MKKLSNLKSLVKKRKIIGRGGDRGGTSGKGHKGQKARSGPSIGAAFEGGQMPLIRRLPKRGFSNVVFKKAFEIVNLSNLNGKFEPGDLVDKNSLIEKKIIKGARGAYIKILGNGKLDKKLVIYADAFSDSAKKAIMDKGGEANIVKE